MSNPNFITLDTASEQVREYLSQTLNLTEERIAGFLKELDTEAQKGTTAGLNKAVPEDEAVEGILIPLEADDKFDRKNFINEIQHLLAKSDLRIDIISQFTGISVDELNELGGLEEPKPFKTGFNV